MPLYLRFLGTPPRDVPLWTGIISALAYVLGLPLIPFWGVWADKYSRRAVIARSAFVEMLVFAGIALSRNRFQLVVPALMVGLQLGNTGVMLSSLRAVTPPRHLGLVISLFALTPPLGIALGPALGGVLVDSHVFDLRGLYLLDGILSAGTGLMLTLGYREARPEHPPTAPVLRLARQAVRQVFTVRVTLLLFAIFGLGALANNIAAPFFPLVVQRLHRGAGLATAIGVVFGASALVGAALSPVGGYLGDRFGHRRVLVAATAIAGLALGAMAQAANLVQLTLAAVVLGAAYATTSAMVFALLATEVPDERRSATLNLVYVPLYFAGIVGGSLGAAITRALGLDAVLLTGALVALGAAVLALASANRRAGLTPAA